MMAIGILFKVLPPCMRTVGGQLSIGTFNGQGLLSPDPMKRNCKTPHFRRLLDTVDILCLQEAHGDRARVELFLPGVCSQFWCFDNPYNARHITGGLLTFWRKSVFPDLQKFHHDPVLPGRVSRVAYAEQGFCTVVWNVHNYEIASAAVIQIAGRIIADHQSAVRAPLEHLLMVAGDWNFLTARDRTFLEALPTVSRSTTYQT